MDAENQIFTITKKWGWTSPPESIMALAQECVSAQSLQTGDLLVELGIVSADQCRKLLESKPEHVKTIDWFTQRDPSITPHVDRVLALKATYPYYAKLNELTTHECMYEREVKDRADSIDATVMLIEATIPVIVFSTYAALLDFKSMGRAEQKHDPIVKQFGGVPHLAVGARDEISIVLRTVNAYNGSTNAAELSNIWIAESAENREKPANRLITRLIDHGIKVGSTDIALIPQRTGEYRVQLRKFGDMISAETIDEYIAPDISEQIMLLLQSKSGANPTNTQQRLPTNGQISYRSTAGDVFSRLSFIPLNHLGELRNLTSVSMRLLPRTEAEVSLDALRLDSDVIEAVKFCMRMGKGMMLVVGPTNSGKSTTVAGAIGEHVKLFGDKRKRLSVEDPIERFLPGITQINVPTHLEREEAFAEILRAFKRHDPDLVWVGEVQDSLTAQMCVAQASTGHGAISTLHANDCVTGFDVLAKMVPIDKRFQLIEACSLILTQRLVRRICPHCREIDSPTEDERKLFAAYCDVVGDHTELPEQVAHASEEGCSKCDGGYWGLVPINEVLPFTRQAKNAATDMMDGIAKRDALASHRTLTMLESGVRLLRKYEIDVAAIFD